MKKLAFLAVLAMACTGCNIRMCAHLEMEPQSCPKKSESFKLSYIEEDIDDNSMDIISWPFSAENVG